MDVNFNFAEERVQSKTLRKKWEKQYGKQWPKDRLTGNNQDVSHKKALADGGTNEVKNIEPKIHSEHMQEHSENGDFKRWSSRSKCTKVGGTALGVIGVIFEFLNLEDAQEQAESFGVDLWTIMIMDLGVPTTVKGDKGNVIYSNFPDGT